MTNDEIIKEEIGAILEDIIQVYEQSGRKASGQFAEGLEAVYSHNKATIKGYVYLAGRGNTKKAHKGGKYLVESILEWIKTKGIQGRNKESGKYITRKALAWAISTKINKQGTKRSEWLKIYRQVITPERVDSIIRRLSEANVNMIITQFRAELEILETNA
jgi:hypothetical protein